jgi:hypothetical protein
MPLLARDKAARIKRLDRLWALRDFDGLRRAGCQRIAGPIWELWDYELEERVLIWSSRNLP